MPLQRKQDERLAGCPIRGTTAVIAGKWKVEIIWYLAFGPRRFAELRDLLPGISEKVLTAQLRMLSRDGIVERIDAGKMPLRVDYALTEAGRELVFVLEKLCDWGVKRLRIPPTMTGRPPMLDEPLVVAQ